MTNIRDDKCVVLMVWDTDGNTGTSCRFKVQGRVYYTDPTRGIDGQQQYLLKDFDVDYFEGYDPATEPTGDDAGAEGPYYFFGRQMQDASGNAIANTWSTHYFTVKSPRLRVNLTTYGAGTGGGTPTASAWVIH